MKSVLAIIFTVLLTISAKAEYNGYHITFTIENTSGVRSKGYAYVAAAYLSLDSLQNTEYLKRALDQGRQEDWTKRKSLTYYKSRIIYNYISVFDQQKSYEYYLNGETTLAYKSIKNITIDDMIDWSYLSGITVLKTSDLSWLNSKPVKSFSLPGFLCDHQVFAYESNKKIDKIIGHAEFLIEELGRLEEIKEERELNGAESGEIESQLEEMNDKIDDEIGKAIEQLKGYKIVVISFCTC